jgi:hypothetical protein
MGAGRQADRYLVYAPTYQPRGREGDIVVQASCLLGGRAGSTDNDSATKPQQASNTNPWAGG